MGKYDVKLYLDEDTKRLPRRLTAIHFTQWINSMLQVLDQRLHLASATAYGAFPAYNGSQAILNSAFAHNRVPFSFTYLPVRKRVCTKCKTDRVEARVVVPPKQNLSFLELREDIITDIDRELRQANSELSTIVICTSDPDFIDIIEDLKSFGYVVILFSNFKKDSNDLTVAEDKFVNAAHFNSMDWSF
ncbi:unnamed protein product [Arabis nemorensis]|uniref:NYN domain-containing protein n=1 Tax=Arabis nemorensis TaxID=586526 RepID=A0A565C2L9_9BRAS|nr:unnamed protein product [Arabis nemorensis]